MTKHTPTPWTYFDAGTTPRGTKAFVLDSKTRGGLAMLEYPAKPYSDDPDVAQEVKANATFIVRACNAHDALVEALETIYKYSTGKAGGTHARILEIADAALKLAKGE